ncbi:DUF7519 family protein [Halomicrobium salinisoli]|uniref:DUF7519 family protein n=1 Tax=Halomicrobium salinisoli TaxID=2878391 RepID=UPI001CF0451A|nr:hypothetical protein [Halomicrobium salinisoli]
MTDLDAADDARPTRASTAVAAAVAVAAAAALVLQAGVATPAALGATGAVLMALLVRAAADQRRAAGSAVASLLVLPVGAGIAAATAGTLLVLSGTLFPVPSAEQLPGTVVRMVAQAMVVVGGVTAVFGAGLTAVGRPQRADVERAAGAALATTLVPLGLGLVGVVTGLLALAAESGRSADLGGGLAGAVGGFSEAVLYPSPVRPHLATFLALVGAATYLGAKAVAALPVTELVADRETAASVERGQRRLAEVGLAALAPVPVVGLFEFALGAEGLASLLPAVAFDGLTVLTTLRGLRSLALWTALAALVVLAGVAALRRAARTPGERVGDVLAPLVVGTAATLVAAAVAGPAVDGAVQWVAGTLPGAIGEQFDLIAGRLVEAIGARAIALAAVGVTGLATGVVLTGLWLVMSLGYVDDRTAGVTVASGTLFAAAAFAGVLSVDPLVVLGALVAAVVVWDVGEFGATLGAEVGRHADTRRTELVHAGGTLAVGGAGAGVALLLADAGVDAAAVSGGTVALGLLVGLAGLLSLVVALR